MTMEKRGDITDRTPGERPEDRDPDAKSAADREPPRPPASDDEADRLEDHPAKRVSDSVRRASDDA